MAKMTTKRLLSNELENYQGRADALHLALYAKDLTHEVCQDGLDHIDELREVLTEIEALLLRGKREAAEANTQTRCLAGDKPTVTL